MGRTWRAYPRPFLGTIVALEWVAFSKSIYTKYRCIFYVFLSIFLLLFSYFVHFLRLCCPFWKNNDIYGSSPKFITWVYIVFTFFANSQNLWQFYELCIKYEYSISMTCRKPDIICLSLLINSI